MKKLIFILLASLFEIGFILFPISSFASEQLESVTTTNLVIESIELILNSNATIVSVSGEVTIKPMNINVLMPISAGDILQDRDILYFNKEAEIVYKLDSGEDHSIKATKPVSYMLRVIPL